MITPVGRVALFTEMKLLTQLSSTDGKTHKITLAFFGALSLYVGYHILHYYPPFITLLAIPFFLGGAFLFWEISKVKDYSTEESIKAYQKEARTMHLRDIEAKHGFANMCAYEIPAHQDFPSIIRSSLKNASFEEILDCYRAYEQSAFSLPPLSVFAQPFTNATMTLTPVQIFKKYPIEELYRFGLLTKQFYEDWLKYSKFCDSHKQAQTCAQTQYHQETKKALHALSKALDNTYGDKPTTLAWIEQLKREVAHLLTTHSTNWVDSSLKVFIEPTVAPNEHIASNMQALFDAHKAFLQIRKKAKDRYDEQNTILKQVLATKEKGLNKHYATAAITNS